MLTSAFGDFWTCPAMVSSRLPVIEFDFSTFIRADGDSMSRPWDPQVMEVSSSENGGIPIAGWFMSWKVCIT